MMIDKLPYRILVVDDDAALRETYRHILSPPPSELGALEALISGSRQAPVDEPLFQVLEADQGERAAALHRQSLERGQPCQLAFIDMRMPPGWDGLRTAVTLRAQDPTLYVVIATAFSDYDVNALQKALGHDVVLLRKPFNQEEVFQLARTLCQSWETRRRLEVLTTEMEARVRERTRELDRRIAQQEVLAEIATRMVELGGEDSCDDAVHWALARLGRLLDADGCGLFRIFHGQACFSLTHEWQAFGIDSIGARFVDVPLEWVTPIYVRLVRDEAYALLSLDSLPKEMDGIRQRLQGIYEGAFVVPVMLAGKLNGALALGFNHRLAGESEHPERLLRTAGHIIFRAIEAHEKSRILREQNVQQAITRNLAHLGTWSLDALSGAASWDEEICRMFGMAQAPEGGLAAWKAMCHPDDWPALDASLKAALADGTPVDLACRIHRPDGEWRLAQLWAQPQFGRDGKVVRLVGLAQDSLRCPPPA